MNTVVHLFLVLWVALFFGDPPAGASQDHLAPPVGNPSHFCIYLYAHDDPVNNIDPSGNETLSGLMLNISTRVYLFAISTAPVATFTKAGLATLTLAAAIHDPGAFVSAFESPSAAANVLSADIAFVAYYGRRSVQFVSGYIAAKTEVAPAAQEILSQSAERIRKLDPNAVVGFRGSTARGYKGPHKNNDPFDPESFDVDAFIVSDDIAAKIGMNRSFRAASEASFPEIVQEQQLIETALRARFHGLKNGPFTFRVYTSREFLNKVSNDSHVLTDGLGVVTD